MRVCACVSEAAIKMERLFISDFLCESGIECAGVSTCDSARLCVCRRDLLSKILFGDCHCGCQSVCACVTKGGINMCGFIFLSECVSVCVCV